MRTVTEDAGTEGTTGGGPAATIQQRAAPIGRHHVVVDHDRVESEQRHHRGGHQQQSRPSSQPRAASRAPTPRSLEQVDAINGDVRRSAFTRRKVPPKRVETKRFALPRGQLHCFAGQTKYTCEAGDPRLPG
uniref:Uncharacterized protein n=1 Tax=Vespula pensylvanica TaxID=30213 RepID=A0A834U7S7_VESPE|nr:hypothetical protein H0235_010512 [Vespula pensylvanica]